MRKIDVDTNKGSIQKLINKIRCGIESALTNYLFLFSEEDVMIFRNAYESLNEENLDEIETKLKPLIFKCWQYEFKNGASYISWLKGNGTKDKKILYSTFSKDTSNSFCNSKLGIKYEISEEGFIGACEKDGATIIEDKEDSIYTVGHIDNKAINSYNLSTPIITPIQVFDNTENDYMSKHNEIIINSKYAKPVVIVCLSDSYKEIAEELSLKYNVEIEYSKIK